MKTMHTFLEARTGIPQRLSGLLAILCLTSAVQAEILVLNAVRDNTIYENTDLSNGAGSTLFAGRSGVNGGSLILRSLVAFDVAGQIPAGAVIQSVTLTLTANTPHGNSGMVELHPAGMDWGEGTSVSVNNGTLGDTASPGDVTWNYALYNSTAWSAPGGDYGGISDSAFVDGNGAVNFSSATMVTEAQNWLDNPSANHGWFVVNANEGGAPGSAIRFGSRESGTPPALLLTYTLAVPEPGTTTLLVFGGIATLWMGQRARRIRGGRE